MYNDDKVESIAKKMKIMNDKWTGNGNGAEGVSTISEALKINTSWTELCLGRNWNTIDKNESVIKKF